ncbi:hypothetical protein PG994_001189 [Apiospora phragmitis]|uniref:F-box domain-containing protein n=1 Tax=Apiospora phragmitis TaxID=2905665 RepID=A0ABR1WST1_9PEZI
MLSPCKLPPDLVELICQWTDETDLLALRLVCRDLAAKTFSRFLPRFFAEVQIIVTSYDLLWLRSVSRHPAYRYSVHKLWIRPCLLEVLHLNYEKYRKQCRFRGKHIDSLNVPPEDEEAYRVYKDSMEEYLALTTTEKLHDALRDQIRAFVFMTLFKGLAVVKSTGLDDCEYSFDTLDMCSEQVDMYSKQYDDDSRYFGVEDIPFYGADWSAWDQLSGISDADIFT